MNTQTINLLRKTIKSFKLQIKSELDAIHPNWTKISFLSKEAEIIENVIDHLKEFGGDLSDAFDRVSPE